jgi:hypothetical protein
MNDSAISLSCNNGSAKGLELIEIVDDEPLGEINLNSLCDANHFVEVFRLVLFNERGHCLEEVLYLLGNDPHVHVEDLMDFILEVKRRFLKSFLGFKIQINLERWERCIGIAADMALRLDC